MVAKSIDPPSGQGIIFYIISKEWANSLAIGVILDLLKHYTILFLFYSVYIIFENILSKIQKFAYWYISIL